MTLPNKLTIGRIAAIPAMIIVECVPYLRDSAMFSTGYGFMSIAKFVNVIICTFYCCKSDRYAGW